MQSMVPVPGDELPVRALRVDLGRRARHRAPYEAILAAAGIRRAGYLVTESMYRDYGDNEHAADARLARRRSARPASSR